MSRIDVQRAQFQFRLRLDYLPDHIQLVDGLSVKFTYSECSIKDPKTNQKMTIYYLNYEFLYNFLPEIYRYSVQLEENERWISNERRDKFGPVRMDTDLTVVINIE